GRAEGENHVAGCQAGEVVFVRDVGYVRADFGAGVAAVWRPFAQAQGVSDGERSVVASQLVALAAVHQGGERLRPAFEIVRLHSPSPFGASGRNATTQTQGFVSQPKPRALLMRSQWRSNAQR